MLLAAVAVLGGITAVHAQVAFLDTGDQSVRVFETLRLNMTAHNASGPVSYSIRLEPEIGFIHPFSGHFVYVPTADQEGTQNISMLAFVSNDEFDQITIQVTVGAPVATVVNITRGANGAHVATVDAGPDDVTGTFVRLVNRTQQADSAPVRIPANSTGYRIASPPLGDGHPQDGTAYLFVVWAGPSDTPPDDRIYAQFAPGRDGFEIISNPHSRPAHYVPDLNAPVQAGGSVTVAPDLSDSDGNAVTITGVTNGTAGWARTNGTAVTYTAYADATGKDTVTYTVTDSLGLGVNGTITITMPSFTVPPNTPGADAIVIPESARYSFNINLTNADSNAYSLYLFAGHHLANGAKIHSNGTFTWKPDEEAGGHTFPFTIFLVYPKYDVIITRDIMLYVNKTNQDPVFDDVVDGQTADVWVPFRLDLNATDADIPAQRLRYSITSQSPGAGNAAMDSATGMITWTPNAAGTKVITASVQDSHDPPGTATMNVTVSARLVVATASVDATWRNQTFTITAYSQDPVSGRILDGAGSTIYNFTGITPATGDTHSVTVVTPRFDPPLEPGTYRYQLARTADVSYAGGDVYNGTFAVPPPILANDDTIVSNGVDELAIDILANDIFEGPVSVTLRPELLTPTSSIEDALYNGTHLIYTPSAGKTLYTPPFIFTYTIQDRFNRSDSARVTIPTVFPAASATVIGTGSYRVFFITAYTTDPISGRILDDGVVIYNFTGIRRADHGYAALLPIEVPFLRIFPVTTTITLEFDPPLEPGTYTYQFARENDVNYASSDVYNGTFTVPITANLDPDDGSVVITPVSDAATGRILEAYMSRGLVVFAGDPQPGLAGSSGAGFLLAGIIINGTYAGGAGPADWNVTDSDDIAVFVREIGNVPPVLSQIGHYTINAGQTLKFRVPVADFGNSTIFYTLSYAPAVATISRLGDFSWRTSSNWVGDYTFLITAYDEYGAYDTESVTVTVLPAGTPNEPPTALDVTATVSPDGRAVIVPAISDPDGDPTRITSATGSAGGIIMPSGNSIEYIAGPNPGTETVTYTVRDSRGAESTGTITITIQ